MEEAKKELESLLKPSKVKLNQVVAIRQNLRNEIQTTLATNHQPINNQMSLMSSLSAGQDSVPHHPHNPSEKAIKLWKEHGK
jgi:hypothetical protein